jgi:pimeloyl-ACP methyl ester carboxylesterase
MAQLMALDEAPALYLGRPCYFDTQDPRCKDAKWWTSHRYADEVVSSMNTALDSLSVNYDSITLIGYSGGGTLAYLLAASRDDVNTLVTMAANLNVGLWATEHGYSPLQGSRDPALEPPLPADIRQLHLWGDADTNVTQEVVSTVVGQQSTAHLVVLEGVDHACCWHEEWPRILSELE